MNNPSLIRLIRYQTASVGRQRGTVRAAAPRAAVVPYSILGPSAVSRLPRDSSEPPDAPVDPIDAVNYESRFLEHLELIEHVIEGVCRRHKLRPSEAEDFASEVKLRFVENDYEILRRFQQRSSLQTYLKVVIQRLFLDCRTRLWGKWRPSAEARRLGDLAVLLERLITRDHWTFDEATSILQTNYQLAVSSQELYELSLKLPARAARRVLVPEQEAERVASGGALPDVALGDGEQEFRSHQVRLALRDAVKTLAPEDRLILRLRFKEGLTIPQIAQLLGTTEKRLYRRCDRLRDRLRESLHAEGFDALDVVAVFDDAESAVPGTREGED